MDTYAQNHVSTLHKTWAAFCTKWLSCTLLFVGNHPYITNRRWVSLVFFIFSFQLAFLRDYSLDIEFSVAIRETKIKTHLILFDDAEPHSLSITRPLYWLFLLPPRIPWSFGFPRRRCFLSSHGDPIKLSKLNKKQKIQNSYANAEIGDQVDILEVSVTFYFISS